MTVPSEIEIGGRALRAPRTYVRVPRTGLVISRDVLLDEGIVIWTLRKSLPAVPYEGFYSVDIFEVMAKVSLVEIERLRFPWATIRRRLKDVLRDINRAIDEHENNECRGEP